MNVNIFSMMISLIKKSLPALAVFAVLAAVLNFGSYNPYNELSTFSPLSAGAQSLSIPVLGSTALTGATTLTTPTSVTIENLSETTDLNTAGTLSVPNLSVPDLSASTNNISFTSCDIKASANTVTTGGSVTISWTTSGFANVTVNGVSMPNPNGSQTFTNIQNNTTYTLVATTADGKSNCTSTVVVGCVPPVIPAPTCTLTPVSTTITSGQSVDLAWTTTNAASASLSGVGAVALSGSRNTGPLTSSQNYTLTVVGTNGQTVTCNSAVTIKPVTQIPSCPISPKAGRVIADFGGKKLLSNSTLADAQTNLFSANVPAGMYDITLVAWDGYAGRELASQAFETYKVNMYANVTLVGTTNATTDLADNVIEATRVDKVNSRYVLPTAISAVQAKHSAYPNNTSANSLYPICIVFDPVVDEPDPVPSCDAFSASPTSIVRGNSSTLSWATTNATIVTIDNGVGAVPVDGTYSVSPLDTTTYTLTATDAKNQRKTCTATITVTPPTNTTPVCDAFTASPTTLPAGGGNVNLTWSTTNATAVSIAPILGNVAVDGSATTSITSTTNFVLTATNGTSTAQCPVTVTVASTPTPISCAANVNFSASPTSITRGNSSTLTWTTTGITSVSFNNGVTATGLSGSTTVTPNDSTTYTMTATDGKTTISCPVTVSVSTGGGGGGSSSPRCELEVSDNTIESGDKVTLKWDTSRATTVILEDKTAKNTLVTTEGLSSSAKERLYDGDIKVSPKKDTTYTLTAKRGSKTRTCTVKVDVKDDVVVTTIRDQKPLVSSIALTEVPYTGFEAGPILTLLFYTLLLAWALYIAYLLVIRRDVIGGLKLAMVKPVAPKLIPEQIRPDVFVASVKAPVMPVSNLVPANLPVGEAVVGYAAAVPKNATEEEVATIENYAHGKRVLLSSDAIRHFMSTTNNQAERTAALDQVIDAAKAQFPAEDGWIVVNEKRMADLCVACAANAVKSSDAPYVPAIIPEGSGSLAEAIVTGNVVAAYEMIGHRPMFALADAAADLDAVYRIRRGENGVASELLMKETAKMSDAAILATIQALTGALDGTYTNEESAVKMAIMKAIKAVA